MTAIQCLEKHGVNCEAIEIDAEYSFKNILNAMEEYKATNDSIGVDADVRQKIFDIIDDIKLIQCGWELGEDIVLYNGEPIGMTITKHNREFDRWLSDFKRLLKHRIENAIG